MNKDKQRFWDALAGPEFESYGCSTCKWMIAVNDAYDEIPPHCGGCEGWDHPSTNPLNKWEWDGVTLDENE